MTPSELVAQYLHLENHVSAAPWAEVSVPLNYDGFVGSGDGRAGYFITVRHGHGDALEAQSRHDAAFIVWCRNNVPTLVAHLKHALADNAILENNYKVAAECETEATEDRDRLRAALDRVRALCDEAEREAAKWRAINEQMKYGGTVTIETTTDTMPFHEKVRRAIDADSPQGDSPSE